MEAYSPDTNTTYPTFDALVAAEGNGYIVIGTSSRPKTVPFAVGPYATREEAKRAQARLRRKWKHEEAEYGDDITVKAYLRVLWKEIVTPAPPASSTQEEAEAVVCDLLGAADFEGMEVCDFAAVVVTRLLESGHVRLP